MLGLILLIAGLVTYFVTEYNTLGIILGGIGATIIAIQVILFVTVANTARKQIKSIRKDFDW